MTAAVLYLRSSKDRHDVSIHAQRAELQRLAAERGITIVGEFVDVVESGKDEDRPGFQQLYDALRTRGRQWNQILVMDTSRLSRRIAAAYWFEDRECKPLGVSVIYRNLPEMDAAERALVKAVFHGVDEWHSLTSRRKGLAGMRQNVQSGFRAGGRAPWGYQLEHTATGAIRDGQPVLKSRLVPDPVKAPIIGRYLQLRAEGMAPGAASRRAGLDLPSSTRRHIEWNALTYAGCTVWNVHAERAAGHAIGGSRRRPRSEWIVREATHEALITMEQAETILRNAETSGSPWRDRAPADYVLAGLLRDSTDNKWQGCRDRGVRYYRLERRVRAEKIEKTILKKVAADLRSPAFIEAIVKAARRLGDPGAEADELAAVWGRIEALDRQIERMTAILAETEARRPLLAQIEKWEAERESLRAGTVELETRLRHARQIAAITAGDIENILADLARNMDSLKPDELRDFLRNLIERITLEPGSPATTRISYRIPVATGDKLASPRRTDLIPALIVDCIVGLAA